LLAGLSAINCNQRWKWLFIIVVGFEAFEATIFIRVLQLFMPEKIPDVFIDILLGMAGGYLAVFIFGNDKISLQAKQHTLVLIIAAVIAFFWTGFYSYRLNIHPDNSWPLNRIVFLFWWVTGYILILTFRKFQRKHNNDFYSILIVSGLFYLLIVPFYYVISEMLNIREISHEQNIFIGSYVILNSSLIKFYLFLPVLLVSAYRWFCHLSRKMYAYNYGLCKN
jgi:hypothetical protein